MYLHSKESGQVLLVGIVMIVIILVSLFILADVHNTIRAKLKLETAQQAAALAAAEWQRESLNLIGEINLLKASNALLQPPGKLDVMQLEYDRLTEMQTRVSFLGPLIGFAAAQQAAKANGINSHGDLSELYLEQLSESNEFYFPSNNDGYINNYNWFLPYKSLVETISQNGIAVRPNASNAFSLTASPPYLEKSSFYREIYLHNNDISGKPSYQMSWGDNLKDMCKKSDSYYENIWWNIQFHSSSFIRQSEIYPLFVKREDMTDYADATPTYEIASEELKNSSVKDNLLPTQQEKPDLQNVDLKWFCYDKNKWDLTTDSEHKARWYPEREPVILVKRIKKAYKYEGPIAYAETGIRVSHLSYYLRPTSSEKFPKGFNIFKTNTSVDSSSIIGAERVIHAPKEIDLSQRPGTMAKTFGQLRDNKNPHTIRMVLPVFHTTSIIPTFLPHRSNFSVLHKLTDLEIFLIWLSRQNDLSGMPPHNTDYYLRALQILTNGPGFRYYCWNPNFDTDKFNETWQNKWYEYYEKRNSNPHQYIYDEQQNPTGPGWLQEPHFYGTNRDREIKKEEKITVKCNICKEKEVTLVGIAQNCFYIIGHEGRVITNGDNDPIREYYGNTFNGSGGNRENIYYVEDAFNAEPGVSRL